MSPIDDGLPLVYLDPGRLCFTRKAVIIRTILGSCVSVTMFNRHYGVSGICHALLPRCEKRRDGCRCEERYRYVDCVVPEMIRRFRENHIRPGEIEAKLFGGSDMFGVENKNGDKNGVGRSNIREVTRQLEAAGVRLKVSVVGGSLGCKIFFNTLNGNVSLKRLERKMRSR